MPSISYQVACPLYPFREIGFKIVIVKNSIDGRYMKLICTQVLGMNFETTNCSLISQTYVLVCPENAPYAGKLVGSCVQGPSNPKNVDSNSHESLPKQVVDCNIFMCMVISFIRFLIMLQRSVNTYETPTNSSQLAGQNLNTVGNCIKLKFVRENGMDSNSSLNEKMVTFTQLKFHLRSFCLLNSTEEEFLLNPNMFIFRGIF